MGCGMSGQRKVEPRSKLQYYKLKEFFEEIARGSKLMLFEDLVLSTDGLASWHPGGEKHITPFVGIILVRTHFPRS